LQSGHVKTVLRELITRFGRPRAIRCDNGSERVAAKLKEDLDKQHIQLVNFEPGKPWQNGSNESFNGTFRKECLNAEVFTSLTGRDRNAGYPAPLAQIPACATNALGSCLEYWRQSVEPGNRVKEQW
jgi:putative transposase